MTDISRSSRFATANIEDLPDDLRHAIDKIAERTGFVPNVFRALAHRPAELRAFMDLHNALMEKKTGLSRAEREMIVVATSAANNCVYCVVAHGAILRVRTRQPLLSDYVAVNYRRANLSPRERTMIDFAVKVATESPNLEDQDFATLHKAGFSEDEIWDIGSITALFAYSNRMADLTAMTPNPEFHTMGR